MARVSLVVIRGTLLAWKKVLMGPGLPVPLAPPITCKARTSLDNLTHAGTVSVRQPRVRRTWQPRPASLVVAIRALTAAFARCSRFRLQTSLFMNDCVHKNGSDFEVN